MKANMPIKANEIQIKKIFSKRLARELRYKGFCVVGIEPNRYKPQFDVYLFEDTEALRRALSEITQ